MTKINTVNESSTEALLNPNLNRKPDTMFKIIVSKFFKNKLAVIGLIFLTIIILSAIFAPLLTPYTPEEQSLRDRLLPPSSDHLLGTDKFGRDIFTRILYGGQISLLVGFISILGSVTIGAIVGSIAGYFGGIIDSILMRIVDTLLAVPTLFLLITLVTIFTPGIDKLIYIFILFGWLGTARLVRAEFLSLRTREFVLSARTMGVKNRSIIFSHILPNAMGPIIVSATLGVGGIILTEAALSYLGLGIQPPIPSWGNMLQDAQNYTIMLKAWWYPTFPGLMILITVLSFNFIGDGLRDAFDPKINE
ncbi:oligopeptide ABC transporter permease [Longirhabdus pacifica]|uniref:oligopeptide ABC transporter permease n=1 Tax=Longirhabdus pacifica TaxID=2305227 RepID=UPI001008FB03|nr:oligopeptide ABC transporter permease [Longirhabdus pacifica]